MKAKILIVLMAVEIVIVSFLGVKIFKDQKDAKTIVSIDPIPKESIVSNPQSKLLNYYEPSSNASFKDSFDWIGYKPKYTINKDSFNDIKDYSLSKPQDTFRIITLGDSWTYGQFVDTKDNWTSLLEDYLNNDFKCQNFKKFEVINLGVCGFDIQMSVERFRLRGQKYNPDMIIWLLKDDDFSEIEEEIAPIRHKITDEYKQKGLLNDQIKNQKTLDTQIEISSLAKDEFHKKYSPNQILDKQKAFLLGINKYFNRNLLIANINIVKPFSEINKKVITDLVKENQNYIFLDSSFTRYNYLTDSFQPHDYHPNKQGHKIIAQDFFKYLTQSKIISCN